MTEVIIFTDGASLGNPGAGGWGAVVLIDKKQIYECGGGEENTTNNRMELSAVVGSFEFLHEQNYSSGNVTLYTDSGYLVNGITKWIHGWVRSGWKTRAKGDVANRDLWERMYALIQSFEIEWRQVIGHSGFPGNERADAIASSFATGENPRLFQGLLDDYDVDVLDFSYDEAIQKEREKKKAHARAKAYSYLSLLNGKARRHKTWKETEERVKGAPGARYRKAISEEHEKEILREWGVSLDS